MTALDSARSMVMMNLDVWKSDGVSITDELVESAIDYVLSAPALGSVDKDDLRANIQASLAIWINPATTLDDERDHVPWYYPERKSERRFWKRYRRYLLERKHRPLDVIGRLDDFTDMILERLEDPTDTGRSFDRRGLVVGHVQSGKTANYTGLICKAIDAGYKVVIILAGLHNSLRSQTQGRLDEELLGFDTAKTLSPSDVRMGVAAMPGEPFEMITSLTARMEEGDFRTSVAQQVGVPPGAQPILLVVKKNVTVLKNVIRYFATNPAATDDPDTGLKIIAGAPLLLIDDEADHASVNTKQILLDEDGNPLQDYDTTRINQLIRDLLLTFRQRAYVGYTATPFANIFIHEDAEHPEHGEDLFPRSFIISLPAPSDYTGPARVFGLEEEDAEGLPIVRLVKDAESFVPDRHKKDLEIPEDLPGSLDDAIRCFVLSCAIRRARGEPTAHNSMLIHVTRFVNVQNQVFLRVQEEITRLRQRLRYGEGQSSERLRDELRELWELDYRTTSNKMGIEVHEGWQDIDRELIPAVDKITLKKINGTASDVLDYRENDETGVNVITVGGDKLARGLTLEGLTVSYYLRASRMYDTLMQMGRWFGYRTGYEDLCRLYTTPSLEEWYRHIAQANEELRELFDEMAMRHETPATFGLRVRSHPVLMVTSRVKMRHRKHLQLSYDGTISETIDFYTEGKVPAANVELTRRFVKNLGGHHDKRRGTYVWNGVDGDAVRDFLSSFKTHEAATRAISDLWGEYIEKQQERDELVTWTVSLVSLAGDSDDQFVTDIGGHEVKCVKRAAVSGGDRRVSIKRLLDPGDELLDFSEGEREKNGFATPGKRPSGSAIREARPIERGLLLIYPLHPRFPTTVADRDLGPFSLEYVPIGLGVSFPTSETAEKVDYEVNRIYWQEEYGDREYRD